VVIAELTSDEAARKLESVLEDKYFKEANVAISIANFVEGDVLVTGAVRAPGSLPFRGDSILTLMEAISRSGGLAERRRATGCGSCAGRRAAAWSAKASR
jgi:protein involved in polysaccharide export with SLBB domain